LLALTPITEQVLQVVKHRIYSGWPRPHGHVAVRPDQHDKGLSAACGSGYCHGVAGDDFDIAPGEAQPGIVEHAGEASGGHD